MGIIRLFFVLIILFGIGGVAFYFAPDDIKEKGLGYISESSIVPAEVKKTLESVYATPQYKRGKLLQELETNLGSLHTFVEENSSDPDPAKQIIERTKKIVEEVLQQNNDPTIIKQITETVTAKLLGEKNKCESGS